ncbi:MAG: hypothetical protein RSA77_03385 [Clostridium sp.]
MERHRSGRKMNNKGSAMIMVLTIISLIAILGAMSMSTALVNIKMRGVNRDSDKNFYYLETALDEIYAQTGRISSEILKAEYASVLGELYKIDSDTIDVEEDANEKANEKLKKQFMDALTTQLQIPLPGGGESDLTEVSKILKDFSPTLTKEEAGGSNFSVTVGEVIFQKDQTKKWSITDIYSGLMLNDICLTYVDPKTNIESALTVDLKIDVPYVQFANGGEALQDYVMAANREISIHSEGELSSSIRLNGNIYGGGVTIDKAEVEANTSLLTAAGDISVKQKGGSLTIGPDIEAGGTSRVWADGIVLDSGAELTSENAEFYVLDDMTLKNNDNRVTLDGSYYGYGNEGNNGKTETKDRSSAILLNGKNSRVDLTGLDSLMLAGRAYLRFNTKAGDSQYVYPMGESLAVRATQTMYLIPERYLHVTPEGGRTEAASSNPILFPPESEKITIGVSLPAGTAGVDEKKGTYEVTRDQAGDSGKTGMINPDDTATPACLVTLNGKIYVYYNFTSDAERSEYFERYLNEQADSFESLLTKSGMTGTKESGNGSDSGVFINDNGRVLTSGSLYQVWNQGEEKPLFQLLQTRQNKTENQGDELGTTLKWVEFENNLRLSFDHIKKNLAETMKVTGKRETLGDGGANLLPMGNYVKISELKKLKQTELYKEKDGCAVFLSGDNVNVNLTGNAATVSLNSKKGSEEMPGGLIVSGGDVTITGTGTFNGLIMAQGKITINGDITLTADAQTYEPLLSDAEIAPYFYDYSDVASNVLNHYEDFVIRENWSRSGREQEATDEKGK